MGRASLFVSLSYALARGTGGQSTRIARHADEDLLSYTTLPDVRPPVLNLTTHNPNGIAPGYWFVTPYVDGTTSGKLGPEWAPLQVGPHIYGGNGDLVWTGARLFPESSTYDLRPAALSDASTGLSFILGRRTSSTKYKHGSNLLLDASYKEIDAFTPADCGTNMHDFYTLPGGSTAIYIISKSTKMPTTDHAYHGSLSRNGFREVNTSNGEVLFEWWAQDHLELSEVATKPPGAGQAGYWDVDHINSVEKTAEGDYIVSARHTDTIYKISSSDGKILWRLGGLMSSFTQDFNFSRQHDARVVGSVSYEGTTVLSFLDNASDGINATARTSSALIIALNHTNGHASLLRRYPRPDGKLTKLRGNVQVLPNGNVLVAWSENSYVTEFSEDGAIVAEVSFASHRYQSYRAYKRPWIGRPDSSDIFIDAGTHGFRRDRLTTVARISWNGATEVFRWRLWGSNSCNHPANETYARFTALGDTLRSGFETEVQVAGSWRYVIAEAIAANASSLGKSSFGIVKPHSSISVDACVPRPERATRLVGRQLDLAAILGLTVLSALVVVLVWKVMLSFATARRRIIVDISEIGL